MVVGWLVGGRRKGEEERRRSVNILTISLLQEVQSSRYAFTHSEQLKSRDGTRAVVWRPGHGKGSDKFRQGVATSRGEVDGSGQESGRLEGDQTKNRGSRRGRKLPRGSHRGKEGHTNHG